MTATLIDDTLPGDTARPLNLTKRIARIRRSIHLPGTRILDGGCGAGEYVLALTQEGADACGIECVPAKVVQWHRAHPGDSRVQLGDLTALPYASASFDAVLLNETLEHMPSEPAALREVHRVLRTGGALIVLSPNRLYPFETHGVYSRISGQYIPPARTLGYPWLPERLAHRLGRPWAKNYFPSQLRRAVRRAGFRIVSTDYVWQTFENISGHQGRILRRSDALLRAVANTLERTPIVRAFGASQLIVAAKGA